MIIKTLYTDFDGTMLDEQTGSCVSPQLVRRLHEVLEVVVVTGRNIEDAISILDEFSIDVILCDWGRTRITRAKGCLSFDYNPGVGRTLALWDSGPAGAIERSGVVTELNKHTDSQLRIDFSRFNPCSSRLSLIGQADYHLVNQFLKDSSIDLEFMEKRRGKGKLPKWHLGARGVTKGQAVYWDMRTRGVSPLEAISIGNEVADMDMSFSTGLYFNCGSLSGVCTDPRDFENDRNDVVAGPSAWMKLAEALLEGISAT